VRGGKYRVFGTDADTSAAAHAFVMVDGGFAVCKFRRSVGADLLTAVAADTEILVHVRFAGAVHLHLACPGTASHADVFQRAAEAGGFMAFEMSQGNKNIRVHDRLSDLGFLHIFAAVYRHIGFVRTFQAVGDQDVASCGEGGETVGICAVQMIQGVFAAAYIQSVAVGEKRFSAQFLHNVGDSFRVIGAEKRQVARLSEMNLDRRIFSVKIYIRYARFFDEAFQLIEKAVVESGAHVGKINF